MDMILKNTFQSISPAYELIGDVTVGTNTTQVDFTGLNIGKDDELLLVSKSVNTTSNPVGADLFINNNTTGTNYYRQVLEGNGTSVTAFRSNSASIFPWDNNTSGLSFVKIRLTNSGYVVAQSEMLRFVGSSGARMFVPHLTTTFTITSLTQLTIKTTEANHLGSGSRFQLYKLVAEKVADIIVPSNTTAVDITGLNIGKDGEYYLTADWVNGVASSVGMSLFINDNITQTNYYNQYLYATGTSVTSARSNNATVFACNSNSSNFANANIKLANSGYYVSQSNSTQMIVTPSFQPELVKRCATSTFNSSSITKLTLTASVTNAIGANSRFTLYKMK